MDKGWKAFWRFKGPTRASFTLWLVRHNRLKTNGLLFTRNVHKDGVCDLCSDKFDSVLHAVRDCTWARGVCGTSFLVLAGGA